jgi:hypothetical protein
MGGATGLDYAAVRAYLDESGITGDERSVVFGGLRAAERAVLDVWADQRKQQQRD